jgi:biotin carboxyl carrier protein
MVFALETFWPSTDGWSAARIEEEIVVTETGHEVITRFPAEELLVAGAHYFTVDGPLPAIRETESKPSKRVREMIEASSKQERVGVGDFGSRAHRVLRLRLPKASYEFCMVNLTMAISVVMPALEMAQETGKLISWLKKEGEPVAKGEPLLEIETDKAVMEIESPGDGVLAGIKVQAGTEVPVGQTIAWIVRPGEVPPPMKSRPHREERPRVAHSSASQAPGCPLSRHAIRISVGQDFSQGAATRHRTRSDLGEVRGSGPGGEILASDILAAAESKSSPPAARLTAAAPSHA